MIFESISIDLSEHISWDIHMHLEPSNLIAVFVAIARMATRLVGINPAAIWKHAHVSVNKYDIHSR